MAIETSQKQKKALSKIEMNGVNKMAIDRASRRSRPVGAREQLDDGDGADQGVTTVTARLRSDFGSIFPRPFHQRQSQRFTQRQAVLSADDNECSKTKADKVLRVINRTI